MKTLSLHRSVRWRDAFSLVEIMVAVTLLALIVIGLLSVFHHTQRALRMANNQTDVLEGARAVVSLVVRDLNEAAPAPFDEFTNLYAGTVTNVFLPRLDGVTQTNTIQDLLFTAHHNDEWRAMGYFVDRSTNSGVLGTLYRFDAETNGPMPRYEWAPQFFKAQVGDTNVHRVTDGIVHFKVNAYDRRGRVYLGWPPQDWPNQALTNGYSTNAVLDMTTNILINAGGFVFRKDYQPAYLEVEVGIMEPETVRQFHAIDSVNPPGAFAFLQQQIGRMHLFRQRIPVRNHEKPEAFD